MKSKKIMLLFIDSRISSNYSGNFEKRENFAELFDKI